MSPESPTSPTTPTSASRAKRARLTEAEKKANHIASEQKRRQAIRDGFDRLADLVPGMKGHGRSENTVLQATIKHIKEQAMLNKRLKEEAAAKGIDVSDLEVPGLEELIKLLEQEAETQNGLQQSAGSYNTVQKNTAQKSTSPQSAESQSARPQSAGQLSTGQLSTGQQSASSQNIGQQSTIPQSTIQQSAIQQSAIQQSTIQQSTIQQSAPLHGTQPEVQPAAFAGVFTGGFGDGSTAYPGGYVGGYTFTGAFPDASG